MKQRFMCMLLSGLLAIALTVSAVSFTSNAGTDPVIDFVERLYTQVLGRSSDPVGLQGWANVLKNNGDTGANVAYGFVFSEEYKNRNVSNEYYVAMLYRTFLNREPDIAGYNGWVDALESGLSRLHVFKGFAESVEYTKLCASYGITRGNVSLTDPCDQNEGITKFVVRCYRLCLNREADRNGLNAWCQELLNNQSTDTAKQVAYGFVFSEEFQKCKLSDTDYVKILYNLFLNRSGGASEVSGWAKALASGESRLSVFNGFADSAEFKQLYEDILSGKAVTTGSGGNRVPPAPETEAPETEAPETQHTHNWVAITEVIYHDAVTEQVWVQDTAAWDEDIYTAQVVCGCGATFTNDTQWEQHSIDGCPYGYSVRSVKTGTIHHDAIGHYETKEVQAAYDETVTTGYKCSSCGATK